MPQIENQLPAGLREKRPIGRLFSSKIIMAQCVCGDKKLWMLNAEKHFLKGFYMVWIQYIIVRTSYQSSLPLQMKHKSLRLSTMALLFKTILKGSSFYRLYPLWHRHLLVFRISGNDHAFFLHLNTKFKMLFENKTCICV